MSMRFYNAGSSIRKIPVESYRSDFNAMSDMGFSNAPNLFFDVQVETEYGSQIYETIPQVRIDAVFDVTTGKNWGDDFKRFIFTQDFDTPQMGQLFKWKNNYWIAMNTDNYQSLSKSAICRRCNNVLRWKDEFDNLIVEPCILNYDLGEAADYTTSQVVITAGFIKLYCQRNQRTNKIRPNKRFLFGVSENRTAYRVYGNGTKIFLNTETENENSPSVSEFYMGASFINDMTDDVPNGIADAYANEYSIAIKDGDIIQSIGFNKKLSASLYKNGEVVDYPLKWTSDNSSIVSVTSDGIISCVSIGNTIVKCYMDSNENVYDEVTVYVTDEISNNYDIVLTPSDRIIYEGDSQQYRCDLTNNGVIISSSFNISASGIPVSHYSLIQIDNNNFTIKNIEKYLNSPLIVTCSSAEYTKNFEINLRGDF